MTTQRSPGYSGVWLMAAPGKSTRVGLVLGILLAWIQNPRRKPLVR